jgi:hypothetical protein
MNFEECREDKTAALVSAPVVVWVEKRRQAQIMKMMLFAPNAEYTRI